MEHLLPHEIVERELEMQEAAKIEERQEEELRVPEGEVEKSWFVKESTMKYQRELSCSHYYKYYNLEGGAEDEDEDDYAVDLSLAINSFAH
ncbi:DNA-directed RNA polymerase II subunit RPB1 [Hordeum vulgare]|nr:DNA-directed RNA polymerase II subunit RPB1 [Hordeum vulgare]